MRRDAGENARKSEVLGWETHATEGNGYARRGCKQIQNFQPHMTVLHGGTLRAPSQPLEPRVPGASRGIAGEKFKFTSSGESGQLAVAISFLGFSPSGSSQPAMCWRAKKTGSGRERQRGDIVVLMPRVVKREHLHNQIIKICIILFFTIRMPHSFPALSLSLFPVEK